MVTTAPPSPAADDPRCRLPLDLERVAAVERVLEALASERAPDAEDVKVVAPLLRASIDRHDRTRFNMHLAFVRRRSTGEPLGESYRAVARAFGCSTRTVRRHVNGR
jgi:hypothetical protein